MPTHEQRAGDPPPLKLTDTPNVAQVIRIYKQLERERSLIFRIRRWWARRNTLDHPDNAMIRQIDSAASERRRFDASGKAVVTPVPAPDRDVADARAPWVACANCGDVRGRHVARAEGEPLRCPGPAGGLSTVFEAVP